MAIPVEHRDEASTANVLTAAFEQPIDQPIELYDNTLREGEQPPGVVFSPDAKLELARRLDELGVPWANIGFPAVSRAEQQAALGITKAGLKMRTAGLSRLLPQDIDGTVDAGVDMVSLFMPGSDVHLVHKLGITESEALDRVSGAVERVKARGVLCSFTIEDGSRTPLARLIKMYERAVAAGADYLVLADTVGVLTPGPTREIFRVLTAMFDRPFGTHFHDDLGLSLANALAALEGGARLVHVTVNGVGERAGNTCLEELAVVLKVKYQRDIGIKLERLNEVCGLVHQMSRTEPPSHKSIVGKWCFTHEAGIHVAGVLAARETYQAFPPRMVGRSHELVLGKHSGTQSVAYLAELHGLALPEAGRREVLERIKRTSEAEGHGVDDAQVLGWIRELSAAAAKAP
jgi:isopropylmalate/homocitrate/citramalate synthase